MRSACRGEGAAIPPIRNYSNREGDRERTRVLKELCLARAIFNRAALNKPVILRNGTWLLPVELPRPWGPWKGLFGTSETDAGALALASTDGGATWERRGTAMVPDSNWPENHILELKDGTLRMYMRSRPGLRVTESRDEGRTWGPVTKPDGMGLSRRRCWRRRLRRTGS